MLAEKYKYPYEIEWDDNPQFTLFAVYDTVEYDKEEIKHGCDLEIFLKKHESENDDVEFYLIPSSKKMDIEITWKFLKKRYQKHYDDFHTLEFFSKIKILHVLSFLTFVGVLLILTLQKDWVEMGLPLEAFLKSGIFENYFHIFVWTIFILFFEKGLSFIGIYSSIVVLFVFVTMFIDRYKYPNIRKHFSFYIQKIILSVILVFIALLVGLFIYIQSSKSNIILEEILSSSIYPKVISDDNKTCVISHLDGKYVYIQTIKTTSSKENNCTNIQVFIKSLKMKPQKFIATKYDDLNTSNIESLEEYCKRLNKKNGFINE